ncbi:hypothetical protein SBA6_990029 [Candidatus Sulfopaludibacter sp. SbA6]|nr:hypothetical protein SBA6_990029 [Candidatus Sulfopaludibacter sp. SbA6]
MHIWHEVERRGAHDTLASSRFKLDPYTSTGIGSDTPLFRVPPLQGRRRPARGRRRERGAPGQ